MSTINNQSGFTLIELLVVIAIIGILATLVLVNIGETRESAKVATSVRQIRALETAVSLYMLHHKRYPPTCDNTCTVNPLEPYFGQDLITFAHPWGGHYTVQAGDVTGDGRIDMYIMWNDDAPQTDHNDNSGGVPLAAMEMIDAAMDDGDLTTGKVLGNGAGNTALNEIVFISSL